MGILDYWGTPEPCTDLCRCSMQTFTPAIILTVFFVLFVLNYYYLLLFTLYF
uniref:Uncharacterized protein n=1 Tax=Anguilla anguilla TaxID=7936 RepID=A0A0E9UGM2_ANGAN